MTPMKLRRRGKSYYIWYSQREAPPNGQLISLKTIVGYPVTDEKKAKSILITLTDEWHRSKLAELDRTNRVTLDEFRQEYISGERRDLSHATLRADDLALRLLAEATGPARAIRAIDANDLDQFKTICLARKLSPHTIRTYLRHIRAALNYAVERGYRSSPPKFPKVKAPKNLPKVLSPESITAILAWAGQNDIETWRYAAFSLWTGCRLQEICGLRWETVKIFPAPIDGICGHAVVTGKGSKQRTIYLVESALDAILCADPMIQSSRDPHQSRDRKGADSPPLTGSRSFIPSPLTGEGQGGGVKRIGRIFKPWTPTTVSKKFKAAARAAGHGHAHFHALRHTAATMMITAGMRFETVKKILGHADIRTTEIYAQVLDAVVMADMSKFASVKLEK